MKRFCVLLVDDEERILNFLKTKLKTSGYEVILAGNGIEALEQVRGQDPDLLILDVMMPKKDGFETLRELRTFSKVPVIMLSAIGEDSDRIRGLGLGADDYLPKPFNPDELIARIEAVRRRLGPEKRKSTMGDLVFQDLNINYEKRKVVVRGKEIKLTRIEWLLLTELAGNADHLMMYTDLLTKVWGPEYRDDVQILRTWVSRLRSKLEINPDDPKIISTVPKTGYIFNTKQADK
ncbi:MAG: response regulator transcription factor [Dehalococcoidales bacterium]|nr:response regulator transcription factor [Dehalococcoidales bacterium]